MNRIMIYMMTLMVNKLFGLDKYGSDRFDASWDLDTLFRIGYITRIYIVQDGIHSVDWMHCVDGINLIKYLLTHFVLYSNSNGTNDIDEYLDGLGAGPAPPYTTGPTLELISTPEATPELTACGLDE